MCTCLCIYIRKHADVCVFGACVYIGIGVHMYVSAMLHVGEEPGLMFCCHGASHDEVLKFQEDGNK